MKKPLWIAALALAAVVPPLAWMAASPVSAQTPAMTAGPPELEYLKAINRAKPAEDAEPILLLSSQFANARRYEEGVRFFEDLLRTFGPRIDATRRAYYLAALAGLRAEHANDIPLLRRIGWVRDTIALLDEARALDGGNNFVARWMSGVVRAQLPGLLGQRDRAIEDLQWCEQNAQRAPQPGWLREVHYRRALLAKEAGDDTQAQAYLRKSGFTGWDKPLVFTTPFSETAQLGHLFSARRITQAVPGKVYTLSGFDFTEFNFVVSDDGRELIAIDAGTRADAAREAYEALRQAVPNLPPLTTVFVTHAHWDHVGGHRFFRGLGQPVRFYGRGNYAAELAHQGDGPQNTLPVFFGPAFRMEDLLSYKPDVAVDQRGEVRIGGTVFELIPAAGGETEDALLVHLPREGVLFAGDIAMPYLGAPFVEEGNLHGLLDAIGVIAERKPRVVLHGHEPLTRLFSRPAVLLELREALQWLEPRVLEAVRRGDERGAIQQANLIAPSILQASQAAQIGYLVLRENVINRLFDQHVGYWQADLQGMDALTLRDKGLLVTDYLGVTQQQAARAAERLMADGKHEQAALLMQWMRGAGPLEAPARETYREAFRRLAGKYQEYNPFKLIVYANQAALPVAAPEVPPAR
ncbi:MAG: MBL fold metallo-hydrolase [Pseudomonadota bacterium]